MGIDSPEVCPLVPIKESFDSSPLLDWLYVSHHKDFA